MTDGNQYAIDKYLYQAEEQERYQELLDAERERDELSDRIEELKTENEKLRLGLEVYKRERDRYRHYTPDITGEYFLSGEYGDKDNNFLPEYVRICPAYGCAWEQIYQKTDKTISYEGS